MDTLKVSKLSPVAVLPSRASQHSAGLDLSSIENLRISAGERVAIRTGLSVAIPEGFYGRVAPRSGLALNNGIDVLAGVVDSDYRGELLCVLINHGSQEFTVAAGDRIAQLIIEKIAMPKAEWVEALAPTSRDNKGFGSTGG